MKTLTVITGNAFKLKEIVKILGQDVPFQITHKKVDLPEYQGDLDFIVREKCKSAANLIDGPVLVEDSSLSIAALNGLPGPYIKWFVDSLGPKGLVRMIKDWQDKSATAICLFAFMESRDSLVHIFKGTAEGKLVEPRGGRLFGWDPCFLPNGHDETYGEMDDELKNSVSHRYNSLVKLKQFLVQQK